MILELLRPAPRIGGGPRTIRVGGDDARASRRGKQRIPQNRAVAAELSRGRPLFTGIELRLQNGEFPAAQILVRVAIVENHLVVLSKYARLALVRTRRLLRTGHTVRTRRLLRTGHTVRLVRT